MKKKPELEVSVTSQRHSTMPQNIENEEKYQNFLKNIHDGCFELDLAGNIIFFNDSICRIVGYSSDELMGMSYRQYTDRKTAKKVLKEYHKVYITGQPSLGFGWQITRKDGAIRYIETSISLQRDSSGKPAGFIGIVNDITERKNMEEKLRREEQLFRALTEQSSDLIILVNRENKVSYINPALEIYLGLKHEDIIGTEIYNYVHPDDLELVADKFSAFFKDTTPNVHRTEIRIPNKDGTWHMVEAVGTNLIQDNVAEAVIVNLRDITERKLAQELLNKSEEQYRLLADHMKDQVWLMDLNLNITYVSPSVERLLGYSSEEIKKTPLDKILTPESLQKASDFTSFRMPKAIKTSSKDLIFRTLELEFILKNGETMWGECSFSLIRDEKGKAVSILGEARNITERKLAEEKLQQTLASLKKAVGTTIQVLVYVLEARDPYTAGHQSRAANLACTIAKEMGLDEDKIEGIRMAATIHDIGKLSIPTEILSKPTKLTNIEFSMIKGHSQSGYEMLKDVESPWPLAEIVHQHHERINGTGYPRNLKSDEILMEARIMAVADVVEAMASHRPYRASLGIDQAIEEIEKNKGILYDDVVVDACLKLFREKGYQLT
jgi:PAS domain S-box-containing protein